MSDKVSPNYSSIEYEFDDKIYTTDDIILKKVDRFQEDSAGYQEPDDDVAVYTFSAQSEHGVFEWEVTTRRTGFNTYAEIEDHSITKEPKECKSLDAVSFDIEFEEEKDF